MNTSVDVCMESTVFPQSKNNDTLFEVHSQNTLFIKVRNFC